MDALEAGDGIFPDPGEPVVVRGVEGDRDRPEEVARGVVLEAARLTMWRLEATLAAMKTVGLRELKNRLSEYVRLVRSGRGIRVTDRGEVVAELLPPHRSITDADGCRGLVSLIDRGSLSPGARNDPRLYPKRPKLLPRGTLRRLLDEERRAC